MYCSLPPSAPSSSSPSQLPPPSPPSTQGPGPKVALHLQLLSLCNELLAQRAELLRGPTLPNLIVLPTPPEPCSRRLQPNAPSQIMAMLTCPVTNIELGCLAMGGRLGKWFPIYMINSTSTKPLSGLCLTHKALQQAGGHVHVVYT